MHVFVKKKDGKIKVQQNDGHHDGKQMDPIIVNEVLWAPSVSVLKRNRKMEILNVNSIGSAGQPSMNMLGVQFDF